MTQVCMSPSLSVETTPSPGIHQPMKRRQMYRAIKRCRCAAKKKGDDQNSADSNEEPLAKRDHVLKVSMPIFFGGDQQKYDATIVAGHGYFEGFTPKKLLHVCFGWPYNDSSIAADAAR